MTCSNASNNKNKNSNNNQYETMYTWKKTVLQTQCPVLSILMVSPGVGGLCPRFLDFARKANEKTRTCTHSHTHTNLSSNEFLADIPHSDDLISNHAVLGAMPKAVLKTARAPRTTC